MAGFVEHSGEEDDVTFRVPLAYEKRVAGVKDGICECVVPKISRLLIS